MTRAQRKARERRRAHATTPEQGSRHANSAHELTEALSDAAPPSEHCKLQNGLTFIRVSPPAVCEPCSKRKIKCVKVSKGSNL